MNILSWSCRRALCPLASLVLALFLTPSASGSMLLTWDVTGTTGTSGSGAASAAAIGVSGSAMTAGAGTALGNSTSPSATWNRNYGVVYADASTAQAASSFISWTTTVSDTYTLTVTNFTGLNLAKTSTAGPTSAELYYSTDGSNFTKVGGTFTVTSTLTSSAATFAPSSPIVIAGVPGGAVVTWRLVPFSGVIGRMGIGSAGTDNFSILGTVTGGAAKDLVWAGGNGAWNTTDLKWTDSNNVSVAFAANDNVTINGGKIIVDAAGVASGSVSVGGSGDTGLSGGSVAGTTLSKTGAGSLELAASNSFSGGSSVTGGTLTLSHNIAIGTAALSVDGATIGVTNPSVTVISNGVSIGTNNATFFVDGSFSAPFAGSFSATGTTSGAGVPKGDPGTFNALTKTGTGTMTFSNNVGTQMSYTTGTNAGVTTSGGIKLDISSGAVVFAGSSKTMNLASGADLDTTNTTYNGMVWNGDFILQVGTVQVNGGNIRGTGKIRVTGVGCTFAQRLNFNSPDIFNDVDVAANSAVALSAASGGSIKLQGALTGSGIVGNSGAGGAVLGNTNPSSFAGSFWVYQSSSNSSGRLTVKAQTLASAASVVFQSGQTGVPKFTIENSSTTSGTVVACPISGPGELTKAYDGDILLTAANTFSAGLVVTDAGTLFITNTNSLGIGPLIAGSANGRIGLHSSATTDTITITNPVLTATRSTNTGVVSTNTNTLAFFPGFDALGVARAIQLDSLVSDVGLLKVSGGGNLHVNNLGNNYIGGTEIGTGAIVIANPAVLSTGPVNFGTGSNSFLRFTASATLNNPVTISGLPGSGTGTNPYTANFSVDSGCEVVLASSIANKLPVGTNFTDQKFGGRVEKWGSGTLVMAAGNNFSETLKLNEGVLVLSNSGAIGATNPVTFNGGTLRLEQPSGEVVAGASTVEADSVLDLGGAPAHTVRFGALNFATTAVTLTVTNTGNGGIYLPTDTPEENLAQIKSAEEPTYTAALDPATGLLSFSAGVVAPTNLSYAPSSVDGVVGTAIPNTSPTVTGTVDSYAIAPQLPAGLSIDPATGVISGTPSAEAPATLHTVTATNAGGSTTADVYISVVTPYQSWAAGYGLSGASALGTSDPDKDGLNNNSEYAFGTDPTVPTATLLTFYGSGSGFVVSWIERNSGFNYSVQSTSNLAVAFASDVGVVVGPSPSQTGVPGGCTRKQFTVPLLGAKFYRLKAAPN